MRQGQVFEVGGNGVGRFWRDGGDQRTELPDVEQGRLGGAGIEGQVRDPAGCLPCTQQFVDTLTTPTIGQHHRTEPDQPVRTLNDGSARILCTPSDGQHPAATHIWSRCGDEQWRPLPWGPPLGIGVIESP